MLSIDWNKSVLAGPRPLGFGTLTPLLLVLALMVGCHSEEGVYSAANQADCLPGITLTDQLGHPLTLSKLKGRPVLVDFIYTRCPGPCMLLMQKMAAVAERIGPAVGSQVTLLSVDIDPEHDGPVQLAQYVSRQDAQASGWYFVTGPPAEIDRVLSFQLVRERESDGSVAHVAGIFLLGASGKEVREYDGKIVRAGLLADEVKQLIAASRG